MKTAVSIPDEVFEKVKRREVTEAMDRVCAAVNDERDGFVTAAARRVLEGTEW